MPEAWLTLSSSICILQLISTLMPLWQQGPRSPFVSVVLLSRHSSVQLWGNMAHEHASLSANSFLGWMRTCVYDAWHGAKSVTSPDPSVSNGLARPLCPPTSAASIWCRRNHFYVTLTHPARVFRTPIEGLRARTLNASAVIRLVYIDGWNTSGSRSEMICF